MGERKSYNTQGDAHLLTFSTFRRARHFRDSSVCEVFLSNLERARATWDFKVWAYVLMPDHVHLLIHPQREDYRIPVLLQSLKQPVSKILKEWKFEARSWQPGGGYDRNIRSPAAILACIEYIHGNPVRARICDIAEDYRWSGAKTYKTGQGAFAADIWKG